MLDEVGGTRWAERRPSAMAGVRETEQGVILETVRMGGAMEFF